MKDRKRKGGVKLVGIYQPNATGRPLLVYGRECSRRMIPHEVSVTEAELLMGVELERPKPGKNVPDGITRKDGITLFLEVDESGKLTRKQYGGKFAHAARADGVTLVLAHGDERMRRVMDWAMKAGAKGHALFSTFERLTAGRGWLSLKA